MEKWIHLGALAHILGAFAHLGFWRLLGWRKQLQALTPINQGVLQVLNLRISYVFVFFAILSYYFATDMLTSYLGQALLAGISLFWWFRAVEQILFFPRYHIGSWAIFVVFCGIASLYLIPLLRLKEVGGLLLPI
ncbi:MAG: hypothetical protein QNL04_04100 [SAR324 cluster bacterium]|nr:hypothetical protein [SAR324 cluster bacterium]